MTPTGRGGRPLVTVVIPCYKQAHFLGEAIESVLNQTYPFREVVVVDDGSPDDTAAVAARYPDVRCVRQENRGLPAARNTGIRCSTGIRLVFLDADDRLLPDALEAGVRCFDAHPDCGFVSGHCRLIGADGAPLAVPPLPQLCVPGDQYLALLRHNTIWMPGCVMYRREALDRVGPFDPSLRAAEDYHLYLRIARAFPTHCHCRVVGEYRRHGENMSGNVELMIRSVRRVRGAEWVHVKRNRRAREAYRAGAGYWRRNFGTQLINQMIGRLKEGSWPSALQSLAGLVRCYPVSFAWLLLRHPAAGRAFRRLWAGRAG